MLRRLLRVACGLLCAAAVAASAAAQPAPPGKATPPAQGSAAPKVTPPPEAASPAPIEAHHTVSGTGVTLIVPAGFSAARDFPGIARATDLSSVMVTELDVPLALASEAFAPDALARRDIEVASTTPVVVDGHSTQLIQATQRIGEMRFSKWFLLLGDDKHSVLLTATTPSDREAQHRDALVHVLETAQWNASEGGGSTNIRR
jgi:hypothetical protein